MFYLIIFCKNLVLISSTTSSLLEQYFFNVYFSFSTLDLLLCYVIIKLN